MTTLFSVMFRCPVTHTVVRTTRTPMTRAEFENWHFAGAKAVDCPACHEKVHRLVREDYFLEGNEDS